MVITLSIDGEVDVDVDVDVEVEVDVDLRCRALPSGALAAVSNTRAEYRARG